MKFLSLYSGIEAASVAWTPLGWECVGVAEIDPFPCAVLVHHYPGVPNLGDVTEISPGPGSADVVVGGSPCQSFSVAGRRLGLDDPRGNLAIEYLRVVRGSRARWMVYENVPGLLSSANGDDFAVFLSIASGWDVPVPPGGWQNSGVIPGRTPDDYGLAYRVLDAQYLGVPQRRRRVFVVGHLGDWRRAAAVLLERHSLSGHPPPGREAESGVAPSVTPGARRASGQRSGEQLAVAPLTTKPWSDRDCQHDKLVAGCLNSGGNDGGFRTEPGEHLVAGTLTAEYGEQSGNGMGEMANGLVAHTLRADGFDASEDGTGRGTPLVICQNGSDIQVSDIPGALTAGMARQTSGDLIAYNVQAQFSEGTGPHARRDPVTKCLDSHGLNPDCQQGGTVVIQPIPFDTTQITSGENRCRPEAGDPCHPLAAQAHPPAIAFQERGRSDGRNLEWQEEQSYALRAIDGGGCGDWFSVAHRTAVRRLTPLECERLQGFPDSYTDVPFRGKRAADGPRYKALGNSMAIPPMRWIGRRIAKVDAIP